MRSGTFARHLCLAACLIAGAAMLGIGEAAAQAQSYWLANGWKKIIKCPGANDGQPVRIVNPSSNWITVYGVLVCQDSGPNYVYDVKFLKVEINKSRLIDIERDPLNFDWIGLAVYKPANGGRTIDWLYDEALPIEGQLTKDSDRQIIFGNLKFTVPKTVVDQASNFTFYFTTQGIPFIFGAL